MKMCSEVFQFEKELKWENPGPGIRRQIMGYDEQLMMVKVQFEKGAVGTMHEHHHSQATYVVSGKFELTIGEQKEILSAGDGYYVAPNKRVAFLWMNEKQVYVPVLSFLFAALPGTGRRCSGN